MHGLHYNHQKKFTENKFKEWSKKARKLRKNFTDEQLEEFKTYEHTHSLSDCTRNQWSYKYAGNTFPFFHGKNLLNVLIH